MNKGAVDVAFIRGQEMQGQKVGQFARKAGSAEVSSGVFAQGAEEPWT